MYNNIDTNNTDENSTNYINSNINLQELITGVVRTNSDGYRETVIGNFLNEGRRTGLLESLLLVGTNMIIDDLSNNVVENNIVNRLINNSFREKPKYKNVLSEEGEKEIKQVKYDPDLHKNHMCPIYHTEFTKDIIVSELPCNHVFSPEGIDRWVKNENAICPVCRYKLSSCEKKREELIEIETYEENEYNTITNGYIFNDISYNLEFPSLNNITVNNRNNTNNINNINLLNRFSYIISREILLQEEEILQETIFNSIVDNS
jgi:hypothetical protein